MIHKKLMILLFALLLPISVFASLEAEFPLDDALYGTDTITNQVDLSQNGSGFGKVFNPGTATNVTISDGAMVFNGVDSQLTSISTYNLSLNNSEFTYSGWIKPNTIVTTNNYNEQPVIFRMNQGSNVLYITQRNSELHFRTDYDFFDQTLRYPQYVNEYKHFVFTISSDNRSRLYVNGVFDEQSVANINGWSDIVSSFDIGYSGTLSYFNGSIDDVLIYNRALNESEVSALYDQGRGSYSLILDGLVAQYSGRDYNGTALAPTEIYDTNHLVSSGPITVPNGTGVWAQPYNLSSKTGMTFDGVDDYVRVDNFSIGEVAPELSWSFWALSSSGTGNSDYILRNSQQSFGTYISYLGTSMQSIIRLNNGSYIITSPISLSANMWQHWTTVYNNQTGLLFYKNGILVSNNSFTSDGLTNTTLASFLEIGRHVYDSNSTMNGSISDLRIYNNSLSPQEVYAIYSGESISTPAIFVSNPNEGETIYNTNKVDLDVLPSGGAIDSVWYNIGGSNITLNAYSTELTLAEGAYNAIVYVNNTLGLISSTTVSWVMGDVNICDNTVNTLSKIFVLMILLSIVFLFVTKIGGFEVDTFTYILVVLIMIAIVVLSQVLVRVLAGATC